MIKFIMTRIALEQFAILNDNIPEGEMSLTTGLEFQASKNGQSVACIAKFTYSDSADNPQLKFVLRCEFGIHPEDAGRFNKDGKTTIPSSVLKLFAMHTVGIARGVLFSKTEGSQWSSAILPPINVDNVIDLKE